MRSAAPRPRQILTENAAVGRIFRQDFPVKGLQYFFLLLIDTITPNQGSLLVVIRPITEPLGNLQSLRRGRLRTGGSRHSVSTARCFWTRLPLIVMSLEMGTATLASHTAGQKKSLGLVRC